MKHVAPWADLFAPLRYAAKDAGRRARSLRGVGVLARSVCGKAKGGEAEAQQRLIAAAEAFDAAPAPEKARALGALLGALERLTPLPPDLRAAMEALGAAPGETAVGDGKAATPPEAKAERLVLEAPRTRGAVQRERAAPATAAPVRAAKAAAPSAPAKAPAGRATRKAAAPSTRGGQEEKGGAATPARIILPAFAHALADWPTASLPGVGPKVAEALARKGIHNVGHLLFHLPRAYQDRRRVARIRDLVPGAPGLVLASVAGVQEVTNRRTRRRFLRVVVEDGSGKLALTFFHYWPGTLRRFQPGRRFYVWGEVKLFGATKQIVHPELEEAEEGADEGRSAGIVPVYRGMDEFGQGRYRALVRAVLERHLAAVPEILPQRLLAERGFPGAREALAAVHFPPPDADFLALAKRVSPWHRRLAYEELFLLSLGLALKARGIQVEPGHAFDTSPERLRRALALLPFEPTGAQRRAIEAIARDMGLPEPMNRLLQGDVGSGKTAVALVACLLAVFDGKQAAVMAPTELLAEQHHQNFRRMLEGTGIEVALLVAGRGAKALQEARRRVAEGRAPIAVGTQALMSGGSAFDALGLVVIDEQHRFGVEQRAELIAKGRRPDVLVMTATPIPRTLALVLHGELQQTVIDELPPGRTPVETKVHAVRDREKVYRFLERELARGRQAYVVYPLIEESERSDLEDATRGHASLQARFPGKRVALLHGRMKAEERDAIMSAFRDGEVDLLVSTTVVEVGVDVPNATVMVIEHAERFGLSQLHQLRGRVGRGAAKSYCFLIDHVAGSGKAGERLRTMERTSDGFEIARADLEIRGPGEFLGTRQAGLPEFSFADLARDARLLEQARADAFALVRMDPELGAPEHRLLRAEVFERFAERMSLARVG